MQHYVRLYQTRFVERHSALNRFCNAFLVIVKVLWKVECLKTKERSSHMQQSTYCQHGVKKPRILFEKIFRRLVTLPQALILSLKNQGHLKNLFSEEIPAPQMTHLALRNISALKSGTMCWISFYRIYEIVSRDHHRHIFYLSNLLAMNAKVCNFDNLQPALSINQSHINDDANRV